MRHQEQFPGQAIAGLRTRLLVMSAAVGIALDESFRALDERSPARAAAVIDGDNVIDDLEDEIDEQALCLLARTQPVACDLRFVVGALRMVADLERIGDAAVSIAEQAILLQDLGQRPEMPEELRQMLRRTRAAFEMAEEAFRGNDGEVALRMRDEDDDAVQSEVLVLHRLMERLTSQPGTDPHWVMHYILVVHSLSRIWRRAVNVAEHVHFITQGQSLKHGGDACRDS